MHPYTGHSTGRSIATDSQSRWVQLWFTDYGLYAVCCQLKGEVRFRTRFLRKVL